MSRYIRCGLLMLLAGCASGSSSIPASRTRQSVTRVELPSGAINLPAQTEAAIRTETIAAEAERVWAVLPAVYAELGIPVTGIDPGRKLLGSGDQRLRRIGGKRLSTYFTCGGAYSDNADGGDAVVSATTQVVAAGAAVATVRTEVQARAKGSNSAGGATGCASTGVLESLIGKMIRERSLGG